MLAKAQEWEAFGDVLTILVYGLAIFLNFEDFIDFATIRVFWVVLKGKENHVLVLLADVLHTLHLRHKKKGGNIL